MSNILHITLSSHIDYCSFISRVEVKDISLQDYIQVRHPVFLPHTAGRYAKKQFKKAQMPIVERLVDRYAAKGANYTNFFVDLSIV